MPYILVQVFPHKYVDQLKEVMKGRQAGCFMKFLAYFVAARSYSMAWLALYHFGRGAFEEIRYSDIYRGTCLGK